MTNEEIRELRKREAEKKMKTYKKIIKESYKYRQGDAREIIEVHQENSWKIEEKFNGESFDKMEKYLFGITNKVLVANGFKKIK